MEQNELRNTIPEHKEYAVLEDGMHIMGLVAIKNVDLRDFQAETTSPGYQLTFRSKDVTDGYVNVRFRSSSNERSNMYKTLKIMSGGKLKKPTSEDLFAIMATSKGQWFNVLTEQKPSTDGRVFVNATSITPIPSAQQKKLGNALDFFANIDNGDRSDKKTGFENYPDAKEGDEFDDDSIPF